MEGFEVGADGKAPGAETSNWWATPSSAPPADRDVQREGRSRRRRNICIVVALLVICAIIAAVVLPTTLAGRTSVVSAVTDGTDSNDTTSDERICNGLASNCFRRVNEIMYPTVHNAMAALENNFPFAYNNLYSLEDALDSGFRGLMMDSCVCTGLGVQLCHSTCAIGYRRPVVVFEGIVDFLNKNTNEIVILELQVGVDSFEGLYEKMQEAANFTDYLYNHPDRSAPWPIVNDLIANNTRLIIFQHDGPDCNAGMCPPGFHSTFEFVMETAWNATELEGLMKFNETCVRTRGRKASAFMLSNHFATNSLGLPEQEIAEDVNLAVNIQNRTDACTEMLGRMTNLLAVDYWSIGDTLQVVQDYNMALPAITESPSMSPMPSTIPSATPTLSPRPSAQPTVTESGAPTETPTESPTAAPTEAPVLDTVAAEESFAPSSGAVDTSMPTTGTSAPVTPPTVFVLAPVISPVAQTQETFSPAPTTPAPVTPPTIFVLAPVSSPVAQTQETFSPAPTTPAPVQEDSFAPASPAGTFERNGDYD